MLSARRQLRQARQGCCLQRQHEDPLREVTEAKRPAEIALRSDAELGQEAPRDDHVQIVDSHAEQHGPHARKSLAHRSAPNSQGRYLKIADRSKTRPLADCLEQSSNDGSDGEREDWVSAPRRDESWQAEGTADEGDVE